VGALKLAGKCEARLLGVSLVDPDEDSAFQLTIIATNVEVLRRIQYVSSWIETLRTNLGMCSKR
jgi:hypothetical protein